MVRHTRLVLALIGTLGLAAAPTSAIGVTSGTGGSEALSALATGTVLLLLAAAARRAPIGKP